MFLPSLTHRFYRALLLAFSSLSIGLQAAPYGPEGMEIEWTQPDGAKLQLRVLGDEFYARTETLDGYTVVYDAATKSYQYATLSPNGRELLPTKVSPGKGDPKALGLTKRLEIDAKTRETLWKSRYERLAPNDRANWAKRVLAARQRKGFDLDKPAPTLEGAAASGDPNGNQSGATNEASAAAFAPVTGSFVGLTILVQFPDDPATVTVDPTTYPTTRTKMERFCNQIGYTDDGHTGSVRDYFLAQSLNQTDYTQVVTEVVTLPQPRNYYNWLDYPTNTTIRDGGLTGRLVLNDAITILKNQGFDFSSLTRNGSNQVIATNILFAGATSGVWPDGLWPHRWVMSPSINVGTTSSPIYIYDYQITNAQTSAVPIGTFCHENGHLLLKYPDLYDYGGESRGVGDHCLMGGGNYNNGGKTPSPINGYFKDVSGWSNVVDITTSQAFTDGLPTTNNEGYRIRKPGTSTEYFLIENRGTGDPWAQYSRDKGILIWHIDETVSGTENQQMTASQHYGVSLEQADGFFDLEMNRDGGDSTDAFDSTFPNFNDTTTPNAQWWNGSNSGIQLSVLSAAGASMDVRFGAAPNTIFVSTPNGGESVTRNSVQNITWSANVTGNLKIELFKAGSLYSILSANETNDGSYFWYVPFDLPLTNDYTIKISSVDNPAYSDVSNAAFSVIANPLTDALDSTELPWSTSGSLNWISQTTITKDGIDAAQSGAITHSQDSSLETTTTSSGTLTFWWKVSSESGYDYLRLYLNGVEQTGSNAKISGNIDWVQKTLTIPSGTNTVKWNYSKDGSVSSNSDKAWVDQVVFTPTSAPEIAVEYPLGTNLVDGSANINFGSVIEGNSSSAFEYTIKNVGTTNLSGLVLSKSGTHSADFVLSALGATTLSPGASTTFTVTFTPGAAGTRSAILQIASNDANENPFDINLTGTGTGIGTLAVTPADNLTASGNYGGSFSPNSIVYTLNNPGSTTITWSASSPQSWVTLNNTGGTLAPSSTAYVTASINTGANALIVGNHVAAVNFTSSTTGNTSRNVALTVNQAPATVTLGNLAQTYNGTAKSVSVTTNPASLAHSVTYNGSSTAPTNAGTYAVVATITNSNYIGSGSGSLVISKASQTINFAALAPVLDNASPFALNATATSGLSISYASSDTAVATVSGNTVTVVGLGTTTITASQAGNSNYNAATSVPQTLTVVRSNPLAGTGGPYKVIIGQSLSLNGSTSQPSYGNTITNYEWDLNNNGVFGDATGATPSAITYSSLTSTWGMIQGFNTIQLKVTDSSGKTSTVSTTVQLINSLTWDANGTGSGQTNGAGAWLGAGLWWDGSANVNWTSGSNAVFGGTSSAGGAVTLASPTSVNTITFNTFTGTYTLGTAGNILSINGGITKNNASETVNIVSPINLGTNQTWTNNSGSGLTASAGLDNMGFLLTVNGTGNTSLTGVISGGGGITKNGSGKLIFNTGDTHTNSYLGTTTINSGILVMGNNVNSLGSGNLTLNGGMLGFYWGAGLTRTLGTASNEVQILGGVSGFGGEGTTGPTINLGTTVIWGAAGEGSATGLFNPSKFALGSAYTSNAAITTFSSGINLNGATRTIVVNGGINGTVRAIISGAISNSVGTAGLIKEGAGILNLANNSSAWNGSTTISEGLLDFGGINLANIGGGTGRNISVAAGTSVRFDNLSNTLLNRLVETNAEITVMTAGTANSFNFSSSAGANLPNAFLGNWSSNGAKTELTGTITPANDSYRLGSPTSNGLLGIVGTNKLTGTQGLIVGGNRVELAGANLFSGDTFIRDGARLYLGNNLALQNSAFDTGTLLNTGTFGLSDGTNGGKTTGSSASPSPTFGGLKGSRNLLNAYNSANAGNNATLLAASAITGFTLNPTAGVSCSYSGNIADFATGTTLTKVGQGTQVLTGSNSYTGATNVNAGKLFIDGTLSNVATALNVATGATLGGLGTIGRNITIADGGKLEFHLSSNAASHNPLDLSTGRNVVFSGNSELTITSSAGASPGVYTLITGGNNISGLAPTTLNLPSGWIASVSISGNNLLLNVSSTIGDSTAPTLSTIIDDKGGASVTANTLVIYTLTFSEDINDSTVDVTDFGNAGTATGAVGLITKTSPGVFTVQVTPTSPGSLQFRINSGAVITDLAGNALNTSAAILDETVITVNPQMTNVPSVVGLAQTLAESNIIAANLVVGTVTTQYHATVAAGNVISQNPSGGTSVAQNSAVNLVVSLGPVMITVPNVVGQTQANAQANIIAATLAVGTVTTAYDAIVPAGSVISQSPTGGTSIAQNSAVNLVVSLGPTMTTVPNVVGQTQASAQSLIAAANLVVGTVTTKSHATIPAGSVISQSPSGGASVAENSAVDFAISTGPDTVTVPNVIGLSQANAETSIIGAKLLVGTVTLQNHATIPAGHVINQNPIGAANALEGTNVNLVVSRGPYTQYHYAETNNQVSGTLGGSITNTQASDNAYQTLTEIAETTGNPNNRRSYLEHKWTFTVAASDTLSFHVEAHHTSNSENDDFRFAYSTTGLNGTYSDMLTVIKTSDNNTSQSFTMPSGISGTVHVRVIDTDRTGSRNSADTLSIDRMYFLSQIQEITTATVPNVVGQTQSAAETNIVAANLVVGTVTTQSSNTVAEGRVISQTPGGGNSVAANSAVNLVVSSGPQVFTVTFDANGGITPTPTSIDVVNAANYGILATTSRTGYTFNGWFTAASGGTQVTTDTTVTANHTLYAQWTINSYTLTYLAGNGGTISGTSPQIVNHGANATTVTALPNTYYHFVKWSDNVMTASRTDTNVTAAHAVTALFALTNYTTWTQGTFAQTFTDNGMTNNPDGDTLTNLQEFAFGTDPTVSVLRPISFQFDGNVNEPGVPVPMNFAAVGEPEEFHAVFARRKDYLTAGINYTVQFSADLITWTNHTGAPIVETGAGNTANVEAVSVIFPDAVPADGGPKKPKFFRVTVSAP